MLRESSWKIVNPDEMIARLANAFEATNEPADGVPPFLGRERESRSEELERVRGELLASADDLDERWRRVLDNNTWTWRWRFAILAIPSLAFVVSISCAAVNQTIVAGSLAGLFGTGALGTAGYFLEQLRKLQDERSYVQMKIRRHRARIQAAATREELKQIADEIAEELKERTPTK